MKRFFVILLAVVLVLCGCQSFAQQENAATNTNMTNSNLQACDRIAKTAETYEAYLELLNTITIPYKFVHFYDLRHFGEFRTFLIHDYPQMEEGHRYMTYYFNDASGLRPILTIKSEMGIYNPYGQLSDDDVQLSDMRHAKNGGMYEFFGLYYHYYADGRLKEIFWMDEDTTYILYTFEEISDYPYGYDTLVSSLLNLEGKTEEDVWAILAGNAE